MRDVITVKKYRKGREGIVDYIYNDKKNHAKMRGGGCQVPKNKGRIGIADCIYYGKKLRKNEGRRMSALTKILRTAGLPSLEISNFFSVWSLRKSTISLGVSLSRQLIFVILIIPWDYNTNRNNMQENSFITVFSIRHGFEVECGSL